MLVMLNSPPGAGKDTFFNLAKNYFPKDHAKRFAFADPLWRGFRALNGLEYMTDAEFERHKREKTSTEKFAPWLYEAGVTHIRPGMIDIAEEYMKKKYGNDVFAQIQVRSIQSFLSTVVDKKACLACITDLGFVEEFNEIVFKFAYFIPTHIVYIERDGCDYSIDSRGRIENTYDDVKVWTIRNCGTGEYDLAVKDLLEKMYDGSYGKA